MLHLLAQKSASLLGTRAVRFEQQFVVNLQNQTCVKTTLAQSLVYTHHRKLDHVGGSSLNRAVHRNTFTEFLLNLIGSRKLGDLAAATKQCGHVAVLVSLLDKFLQVSVNTGIACKIAVDKLLRLRTRNAEIVRK